jgi:hypothetical protein
MHVKKQLFGLVRDATGRPKVDGDPRDLPPQIKAMLTPADRQYLGMSEDD